MPEESRAMSDSAQDQTAQSLGHFAAATGRPIAPEYLQRASELYRVLVEGLAVIPVGDLLEVEPALLFSVDE
jgi:hypothetical protein